MPVGDGDASGVEVETLGVGAGVLDDVGVLEAVGVVEAGGVVLWAAVWPDVQVTLLPSADRTQTICDPAVDADGDGEAVVVRVVVVYTTRGGPRPAADAVGMATGLAVATGITPVRGSWTTCAGA